MKICCENKWISIKNRLPIIGKHILTYEKYARMPIKVNYIHNYENEFSYGKKENITHWMPLPELPESIK